MHQTDGEYLIFLASLPRSGSTMLQCMLGAHSQIHTESEPWLMLHPVYALKREGIQTEYHHPLYQSGVGEFLEQHEEGLHAYYRALAAFGHTLYKPVLDKSGKRFFLDKTPRYHLILPELAAIFPKAKFVLLLRNPLAVLASVLKTWVKRELVLLRDYNVDLLKGIKCMAHGMDMLGERAHVVHYESLVAKPGMEMAKLMTFLGLEFEEQTITYGEHRSLKGTMGDPTNVHRYNRPMKAFANAWIETFRDPMYRQVAHTYLENMDHDALQTLGYPASNLLRGLTSKPVLGADEQTPAPDAPPPSDSPASSEAQQ